MAFVANASTIHPGEVRITTGKVLAIDSGANALVMESPTGKGPLTVGVTMKEDAAIRKANKAVGLGALKVDEPVTLTYTQENSRLIGLEVTAR
jgi:hypothetical protein